MAKETVNIHACLDRREGNKAVLLLGDEETGGFSTEIPAGRY